MSKKIENKKEVLMSAKPSRKQYIPFYFMVLFLAGVLIYLDIIGKEVSWISLVSLLLFFLIGLNVTELHRKNTLFEVTPKSISCIYDRILNKNIQKIDYFGISDIYVKNNVWQWIWGYGDIYIRLFSKDAIINMKNINNPNKFAEKVEDMMARVRSSSKEEENKEQE